MQALPAETEGHHYEDYSLEEDMQGFREGVPVEGIQDYWQVGILEGDGLHRQEHYGLVGDMQDCSAELGVLVGDMQG